jgi:hypothetical protein
MRLISGLILISFLLAAHGSNTPQTFELHSELQGEPQNDQEFPVIYGKKDDGFPDRVNLRGTITKVSFARDCGLVHAGGVLHIKVARTAPGFNSEHIYVVAPCLLGPEGEEQYEGKVVCMSVKKMKLGDMCHSDYIHNNIDSKGVPFYCLLWQSWKPKEFLKQVACKVNE